MQDQHMVSRHLLWFFPLLGLLALRLGRAGGVCLLKGLSVLDGVAREEQIQKLVEKLHVLLLQLSFLLTRGLRRRGLHSQLPFLICNRVSRYSKSLLWTFELSSSSWGCCAGDFGVFLV